MTHHDPEAGDIILSWLVRLVVTVAVFALVVFEVVAIILAAVRVDDAAGEVARAAAVAYGSSGSLEQSTEIAEQTADRSRVRLETFDRDGAALVIEVSTQADTLLLHRLPGTDDIVTRRATRRVDPSG
jgi:hypothetical protein